MLSAARLTLFSTSQPRRRSLLGDGLTTMPKEVVGPMFISSGNDQKKRLVKAMSP